jgi:hypothetical protein
MPYSAAAGIAAHSTSCLNALDNIAAIALPQLFRIMALCQSASKFQLSLSCCIRF